MGRPAIRLNWPQPSAVAFGLIGMLTGVSSLFLSWQTSREESALVLNGPKSTGRLTAVLFVDIVDATPLALSLGDRAWAELLEQYHQLARDALARHRGRLMDTAGDGFFAIFDEARDAIRAALDVQASAKQLGLELRSGVHLGSCWQADEKCAGADVHIGARLATSAAAGEVLVSEEAAEQARRAGIRVTDRGTLPLKGLPGSRRVFATTAESQQPTANASSSAACRGV